MTFKTQKQPISINRRLLAALAVALLLAGLVVQMYASWMIDKENRKSEK